MKKLFLLVLFYFISVSFIFSCAVTPEAMETVPMDEVVSEAMPDIEDPILERVPPEISVHEQETLQHESLASALPSAPFIEESVDPERLLKPIVPEYIMGNGLILPEDMMSFLINSNPEAEREFVENLILLYIEEAAIEGVNHDTAFAQMCLETGYLQYGGLVTADQNNFCGLGATGPGVPGERFPSPQMGVRAHIQHLKAYATEEPLVQELVDPRYFYVRFGSSPSIKGLAGTWAADPLYADKIKNILERLYTFAYEPVNEPLYEAMTEEPVYEPLIESVHESVTEEPVYESVCESNEEILY